MKPRLSRVGKAKPLVLQHCVSTTKIGGPMTGLRFLMDSELAKSYRFETCFQDRPAGGINPRLILQMARRIRAVRPDILHVRGLQNEGFHGMVAGRLAGCRRIVLSVHGFIDDALYYPWWRKKIIRDILEPYTLRAATAVYCACAHAAAKPVIARYARRNLGYIHNAVPLYKLEPPDPVLRAEFGFTSKDVIAICVTRISRDKGLLDLQKAMSLLHGRGVRAPKLLLVGSGRDFELVSAKMQPLVQAGQVAMAGRRDDVRSLLAISDFFVLPTLHENLSNAILEAMSAGKAVLTTGVGGNPEVVLDGRTGVLVPPRTPETLADALQSLAADPTRRARMGEAGRERVEEHFSMSLLAKRLDAVYQEVLQL